MANGVQVRTLDELKENWDLEKALNYYINGKLQTWLTDRYYTELADEVAALNGITDNTELQHKLCGIFGIEMEEDIVDVEAVAERNRRLEILRQYTADDAVLKNVDKVAFNQEELADLLDEDENVIYLCDNKYSIPLSLKGKKYIGLGDVEIQINSKEYVDFAKLEIELVNVHFNKEYEELVNSHVTLYKKGEELEANKKYSEAFEYYYKAAEMGNDKALFKVGYFYRFALGVEEDFTKAMFYFQKSAQKGNARAMHNIGSLYYYGSGVEKNYTEALNWYEKAAGLNFALSSEILGDMYRLGIGTTVDYLKAKQWYEKAADLGNGTAMGRIGNLYYDGNGVAQDYTKALEWFKKSAALNSALGLSNVGHMYQFGLGTARDYSEAMKWYKKAADLGDDWSMNRIGNLYYEANGVKEDCEEAYKWYKKATDLGNSDAIANIINLYERRRIPYGDDVDDIILSWYEKLIDMGEIDRVYEMLTNWQVEPSCRNKRILMKKMADLGYANAAYETAKIFSNREYYINGWLEPDRDIVLKYYQKAINLGHPDAQSAYESYKQAWGL